MATEKRVYSDLPIPPGEYLAEVLEAKGMPQAELARRIGRPIQAINEIINGEKSLTPTTALELERALDVPAHIWTGLESRCQLIKAKEQEKKLIQQELTHLPNTPYKQLADMGCVERTRDGTHKIRELHRFYGVSSLVNLPETRAYAASFRRSPKRIASGYALAAWLRCAELRAAEAHADAYDKTKLKAALGEIRAMTKRDPADYLPELAGLLAGCGVALILIPHFSKTYAHGATFWLNSDKAVLLMSIRGKWADIFWFSLFHEIGHLLLHKKTTFIDDGNTPPENLPLEQEADDFAMNKLVPADKFHEFICRNDLRREAVRAFAEEMGISVGIVVGRLQHEGVIEHDSELNRLRNRYEWK
jgi:HTH-type transcriptional regulator/antitoxin HigA